MRFWSLACSLPLSLALGSSALSCGDKSAVSLTVVMDQANVSAQASALGTNVVGSFQLEFDLGPEASGSTTVTLGSFALQTAAGGPLVDPLQIDTTAATFPLTVEKGSSQTVSFTLSSKKLLTSAERDALCAGPVRIVGTVMDSANGGTDSLTSNPITPTCG